MDSTLLLIAAIVGGFGIVVMIAATFIIGLAWVRVLRGMREHDEAEERLKAVHASVRRLPHRDTAGRR